MQPQWIEIGSTMFLLIKICLEITHLIPTLPFAIPDSNCPCLCLCCFCSPDEPFHSRTSKMSYFFSNCCFSPPVMDCALNQVSAVSNSSALFPPAPPTEWEENSTGPWLSHHQPPHHFPTLPPPSISSHHQSQPSASVPLSVETAFSITPWLTHSFPTKVLSCQCEATCKLEEQGISLAT